nr:hypothetical protein [Sphingobium sp. OAS761]
MFGLALLQLLYTSLVRLDECLARCTHDATHELVYFLFDAFHLAFEMALALTGVVDLLLPQNAERFVGHGEQVTRWLKRLEQGFKLAFDPVAGNGATVGDTALLPAMIVGIAGVASLGPATGQARAAVSTDDRSAQGKVGIPV